MSITQLKTPLSPPSPRESFWKSIFVAAIIGFTILQFFYVVTGVRKGLTPETYDFFKDYLSRCLENISQGSIREHLIPVETWISAATISLTTIKQKQWSDIRNYTTGRLELEIKKKKSLFYAFASLASVSAVIAAIGTVCLYKDPSVETWFLSFVLWFAFYITSRIPSFMEGENIELSLIYAEAIKALGRSYLLSDGLKSTGRRGVGEGVYQHEKSRKSRVGEWFKQFYAAPTFVIISLTILTVFLLGFNNHFSFPVAMVAIAPSVLILLFKIFVAPAIVRRFVVGVDIETTLQVMVYVEIFVFVFVSACFDELIRHKVAHPNQWYIDVFNVYGIPAAVLLWVCVALSLSLVALATFLLSVPKCLGWSMTQKIVWSRSFGLCHTKLLKSNDRFCRETRVKLQGLNVDGLLNSIESEHLSEGHRTRYLIRFAAGNSLG